MLTFWEGLTGLEVRIVTTLTRVRSVSDGSAQALKELRSELDTIKRSLRWMGRGQLPAPVEAGESEGLGLAHGLHAADRREARAGLGRLNLNRVDVDPPARGTDALRKFPGVDRCPVRTSFDEFELDESGDDAAETPTTPLPLPPPGSDLRQDGRQVADPRRHAVSSKLGVLLADPLLPFCWALASASLGVASEFKARPFDPLDR